VLRRIPRNGAVLGNPLVADVKSSTTAYSGISLLESAHDLNSAIQSGDWASVAMGSVGTALDALSMAMDPFGAILAAGVGWLMEHVGPLKEALDALAGNPDQIKANSETWANIAKELGSVSDDLKTMSANDTASWTGEAGDAYRQRAVDLANLMGSAKEGSEGASSGVKTAGEVVAAVRSLVRDIIAELVGHMISWALQVVFTLGIGLAWVVPEVVAAVAKTASEIASITGKLTKALKALVPLLKKAGNLFSDAAKALKNIKPGKAAPSAKPGDLPSGPKGGGTPKGGDGSTTPSGGKGDTPPPKSDPAPPPKSDPDGSTTPSGAGGGSGGGSSKPGGGADSTPTPKPGGDSSPGGGGSTTPSGGGGTPKGGPDGGKPKGGPDGGTPKDSPAIKDSNPDPKENSSPADCRPGSGDPIDMTTGRMMLTQTDFELGGVLPLVLSRSHFSGYRTGRRFGGSWASTVDQRLEIDESGVYFAAEDGTLLTYPLPGNGSVLPVEGPQWPLTRSPEGGYVIEQRERGQILYFGRDGNRRLPITAIFDNDGNRIHFCHDSAGNLTEIRHSAGHRVEVETTAGYVTALTLLGEDEDDRTLLVRYGYDQSRRLVEVVNSSGQALHFAYDDRGRIVRWEDRNNRSYDFAYDESDRCVRGDGTDGYLSYTFEYDRENRISRATDSLGNTVTYLMNEDFQLIRETDPLGHSLEWDWDRHDRLIARTDELGRTHRYHYDENGDLTALTRPDLSQTLIEYDDFHRPVTVVEPDGAVWRREYDERGRLSAVVDPLGATSRYEYADGGWLRAFTDEEGNRTEVECDALGKPLVITDPLGAKTCYGYDGLGRVTTVTDPIGGITRFGWTVEGAHWQRSLPDGTMERRVYDGEGNVREDVGANGTITRTDFGPFDLPVTEIAPDGGRTRYAYDTELRLTSVTDAQGLRWTFEYDAVGNKVRETDFDGRELSYRYDAAGQLVEKVNAAGEVTTYTWDILGNVVEKRTGALVSRFDYDAAGRLTRAVNADADVVFAYDANGRIVSETCNGRSVLSRYDRAGRRVRRRTPSGAESTWSYDATSSPVELNTSRGAIRFAYDAAGREIGRGFGAANVVQAWDVNHRLLSQTMTGAPQVPGGAPSIAQHRAYLQDADSVVTGIEDLLSGRREFALDRVGRVAEVRGATGVERYSYDRSGNVLAGAAEYDGTVLSRLGSVRYRHDAQGRMIWREQAGTSGRGWSFAWNADDRLIGVVTPDGQQWRYRYDALGRRVAKQRLGVDGRQVVDETVFVWDGSTLAEQHHVDTPGSLRTTTWDWEPGDERPVGQFERIVTGEGVDERFYAIVTDLIGAPTELLDDTGKVVWHRRQSLWGQSTAEVAGAPTTPLRFPGQYFDAETGLHYNFHRYYDPEAGRFVSADPIGFAGGLNPHAYVPNPLTWSDPLGLVRGCKKGKGKSSLDENGLIPDKGGKGATSPEGLHYDTQSRYPNIGNGQGSNRGEKSRLDHILLHSDNDAPGPNGRPKNNHGVWGTQGGNAWDTSKITKTIDQGWAKRNDPGVNVVQQDGRTVYTIPMGKTVGYNGQDPLTSMTIVVEGKNNVVTAFPI